MSWTERAACAGQPLDLFFPGKGQAHLTKKAKAICKGCPVDQECLTDTLRYERDSTRHGIYGGLTQTERNDLFGVPRTSSLPDTVECAS